jgi:Tfp pilus assembly ATPase PilU
VQQSKIGMVLRTITTAIPRWRPGLPSVLKDVVMNKHGPMIGWRHRLGKIDHARGDDRPP